MLSATLAFGGVTLALIVGIPPVRSAIAQPGVLNVSGEIAQPGPLDVSGEINGAPFRIVVPAVWNGTMIEFARGHVDKADHPGEVDNRNPTIAPSPAVRDALLARGYALAGSARKDNGWSVEEGLDDVVALASYFRENVANPTSTILWGGSGGTVITLETAERNGGAFDGYLTTCNVGAGAPRAWDQALSCDWPTTSRSACPTRGARLATSATTSTTKRRWCRFCPPRPVTRRASAGSSSSGW